MKLCGGGGGGGGGYSMPDRMILTERFRRPNPSDHTPPAGQNARGVCAGSDRF